MKLMLMGNGYWGSKLKRVFESQGHEFVHIVNAPQDGADEVEVAVGMGATAAVIATPPLTHYRLSKAALESGMDVLVEKPLSHDGGTALDLANLAFERGRVLSVDSTFVHSDAFKFLTTQGPLRFYQSLRLAPGPSMAGGIDAGWDLIVHDISILHRLGALNEDREAAVGSSWKDTAQASLWLSKAGGVARMTASRCWPTKVRDTVLQFENSMLLWSGGNSVFDNEKQRAVFEGTVEPLANLVSDFAQRCQNRELTGITDGNHGAVVCSILHNLFGPCGGMCQ